MWSSCDAAANLRKYDQLDIMSCKWSQLHCSPGSTGWSTLVQDCKNNHQKELKPVKSCVKVTSHDLGLLSGK